MPHIHEHYDFVVSFFIVHGDRVLLINHPRYGKWISPGGHIELDEDPEEALYREIAEETGLEVEILSSKPDIQSPESKFMPTPSFMDVHEANLPHRHIALVYFGRSASAEVKLSAEHLDYKWFSKEDLRLPEYKLTPAIIFYAEAALDVARNS